MDMAELSFEKKKVSRNKNIFPPGSDVEKVLSVVKHAKVPGELRIGIPGNGGVNFIEFLEKEKTETVFYDPDEDE